mmetsp:Transcript_25681/g.64594  ORF Transcript_25681/g.64594 Transcript_25681/m.64594 type:complete len:374 (-) Transcript_25681:251-1372(-)
MGANNGKLAGECTPDMTAMACHAKDDFDLKATAFELHPPGDDDVAFDVKFCGMCHTDVHFIDNSIGISQYPLVPGHEVVGIATAVGANVRDIKVGDKVAVGCMVESCKDCSACHKHEEQYCREGSTFTYAGVSRGKSGPKGTITKGGYGSKMVVNKEFIVPLPSNVDMAKSAPLLCAGITMYDPLVHFKAAGKRVGIAGAGGLGMMGIAIAKAMGCQVTVISTSPSKEAGCKAKGADTFLVSTDEDAMKAAAGSLDIILDTVSAAHDINSLVSLLDFDGQLVLLGIVSEPPPLNSGPLTFGRKAVAGSLIGSVKATKECLAFCVKKNIYPDIEIIPCSKVGEALKLLAAKNDRLVRYVIDVGGSMPASTGTAV